MRLLVIDANAVLARHYFVVRDSQPCEIASAGEQIMRSLAEKLRASSAVVAFDSPTSFRKSSFAAYKQSRKSDPKKNQVYELGLRCCNEKGWATVQVDGYEADDLVAVAVRRLEPEYESLVVVSGDKDLYQILSDKVSYYSLSKKKLLGVKAAEADFGDVTVSQMAQVKAIMGDRSDNLPGVLGVGIKNAKAVLDTYGDLEAAFSSIRSGCEKLRPKLRNSIYQGREDIRFTLKMVKLPYLGGKELDKLIPTPRIPDSVSQRISAEERASSESPKRFTGIKQQNIVRRPDFNAGQIPQILAANSIVALGSICPRITKTPSPIEKDLETKRLEAYQVEEPKEVALVSGGFGPLHSRHPNLNTLVAGEWTNHGAIEFVDLLEHATSNGSLPMLSLCGIAIAGNEEKLAVANIGSLITCCNFSTRLGSLTKEVNGQTVRCSIEEIEKVYRVRVEKLMSLLYDAAALAAIGSRMKTARWTSQLEGLWGKAD